MKSSRRKDIAQGFFFFDLMVADDVASMGAVQSREHLFPQTIQGAGIGAQCCTSARPSLNSWAEKNSEDIRHSACTDTCVPTYASPNKRP